MGWKGDRTPFDATVEQAGAAAHLAGLMPTLVERPFYDSPSVVFGRRFEFIDGDRKIPLFVYLDNRQISVGVNTGPGPGSVLDKRFVGFENRCVRILYLEMKPAPYDFEIGRNVSDVASDDGMLFYSVGRNYPNLGFHSGNTKTCAFHDPGLKIEDARKLVPADLWGIALSIAPAVQGGGTIITARAP